MGRRSMGRMGCRALGLGGWRVTLTKVVSFMLRKAVGSGTGTLRLGRLLHCRKMGKCSVMGSVLERAARLDTRALYAIRP